LKKIDTLTKIQIYANELLTFIKIKDTDTLSSAAIKHNKAVRLLKRTAIWSAIIPDNIIELCNALIYADKKYAYDTAQVIGFKLRERHQLAIEELQKYCKRHIATGKIIAVPFIAELTVDGWPDSFKTKRKPKRKIKSKPRLTFS